MILGGDQPWTRRVIGVSTCPQVGSMFNEGIWNAQNDRQGSANPRTMEGDEAHYTAFLLGTPSLQAAGCSTHRILKLPRARVVLCILHLTMAMGRLLGEFVDRRLGWLPRRSVKTCKFSCRRGVKVGAFMGHPPRTGRRRPIFLTHGRILVSASALGQAPAKYKAIVNMWDLLQALYCTYQGPNPLNCAAVARDFGRHYAVGTTSWYLLSLEHDADTMLQNIKPFGLAMFSGDISESINRFLKHGHNEHNNRGGGVVGWRGWTRCRVVSGRPSTGRPMCMAWLFAYFDVLWVVHGGPRSHVPCSGEDAMEVRRGQGHMQASVNQSISQHGNARADGRADEAGICHVVRSSGDLGNRSSLDLGSTMGR